MSAIHVSPDEFQMVLQTKHMVTCYMYSSHKGGPGRAMSATVCITSLCIAGENIIGRF